jgi:selenocysteine lyase/cysteine desulfurase
MHHEFPSNYYSWADLAERQGGHVVVVKREEGENWTAALLRGVGRNTAMVAISPCHWTDGSAVDLVRVSERARAVGAALVIDASQALGALPMDLHRIQPDFLVSVGYKWMLGPYGLGYLYVAPKWRNGVPLERSWLTREGSEDFTRLVERTDAFRSGARRFDMGEFPQFHTAPMAIAGLEQIAKWGVPEIAKGIEVLTDRIAMRAKEQGFAVLPKQDRSPHLIGIRKPGGIPSGLPAFLRERKIFVSIRGDAIRVAPHLYNSAEDVDRLFSAMREFHGRSASV